MYIKRILIDGDNEFTEGMTIEFDYSPFGKGSYHCVKTIKKLNDTFFKAENGACFSYEDMKNCVAKA